MMEKANNNNEKKFHFRTFILLWLKLSILDLISYFGLLIYIFI